MTLSSQASAYLASVETMNSWPALMGIWKERGILVKNAEMRVWRDVTHVLVVLHETSTDLRAFLECQVSISWHGAHVIVSCRVRCQEQWQQGGRWG